jgi:branched-chain amino acid aminotransferase
MTTAWKITQASSQPISVAGSDFDSITLDLPAGLYTTFRTYDKRRKVPGLSGHLDRLYVPAEREEIPVVRSRAGLRAMLAELLKILAPDEARVRLILDTTSPERGTLYVLAQPIAALPEDIYQKGVHVILSPARREKPALKQTAFISQSSDERKEIRDDVHEILLTHNGRILEGMTSNFFYVREGVLCTAGKEVLSGITRKIVIQLAKEMGVKVHYRSLRVEEIPQISEAFITSSSRGIVPVVQIAGQRLGNGMVGEITRQLSAGYEARIVELAESIV